MDIENLDINLDDFIPVPPPQNAILKSNYDVEFETDEDIKIKISLGCGEAIEYAQNEDGSFTVWSGTVTLEIPEDVFLPLFRPVDYTKLPKNKRYYSFDQISAELTEGWITWIHDFEEDIVLQAVVSIESSGMEESGYAMYMVVASKGNESGEIDNAIMCRRIRYTFDKYGDTWAALRERYEDEI